MNDIEIEELTDRYLHELDMREPQESPCLEDVREFIARVDSLPEWSAQQIHDFKAHLEGAMDDLLYTYSYENHNFWS